MSAPMPKRFAYVEADPLLGVASSLPYALIDSSSTLNVLPFDVPQDVIPILL